MTPIFNIPLLSRRYGGGGCSFDRTLIGNGQVDSVGTQDDPHCRIELSPRLGIRAERRHFRRPRLRHVTLILDYKEVGGEPHVETLLLNLKRLFLELARIGCGLVG